MRNCFFLFRWKLVAIAVIAFVISMPMYLRGLSNAGNVFAIKGLVEDSSRGKYDLKTAEEYLVKVTTTGYFSNSSHLILARVYEKLKQYRHAIREIEKIDESFIDREQGLLMIGDLYWTMGDYENAYNTWKQIPDVIDYLLRHCLLWLDSDLERAEKYCATAVYIAPKHGWARYSLSRVYQSKNQLDLAENTIRVAIDLDPRIQYYLFLGELLEQMGRVEEAIEVYQLVARLYPENPTAWQKIEELTH